MIKRLAFFVLVLLLPTACATSGDHQIANDQDLLDNKSTRFYVKTIPIPERADEIIVVKKAALETIHRISFSEFLRQVQPVEPPAHYYLMHYSRRSVTTDEADTQKDPSVRHACGNAAQALFRGGFQGNPSIFRRTEDLGNTGECRFRFRPRC